MRLITGLIAGTLIAASFGTACAAPVVRWRCTTEDERWVDKGRVGLGDIKTVSSYIEVDTSLLYQKMDGWGGTFNELGWDALLAANEEDRQEVMKQLFDPKDGCKFNICRMPIGANDFALNYYSLNDNDGDYSMSKFTLERDHKHLIPYIRAAMKYRPDLKVWGSPWSPPAWMKDKKRYSGGRLVMDEQTQAAYALYFEKYVRAYQELGINVFAVHVQNEPFEAPNYPSCLWSGAEMRDFIKNYLGPQFEKNKVNAQVWLGTINQDHYKDYVYDTLTDKDARKYIAGVGFQWGGRPTAAATRSDFPDMPIYSTEHECGNCWWGDWGWGAYKDTAPNDWHYGDYTLGSMIEWLKAGVNVYTQWNMVLEPTGKSGWGWPQNSMITVFKDTGKVRYNPHFHAVKHFTHYIAPGAYRVGVSGDYDGIGEAKKNYWPGGDKIAFVNPNGEQVLVVRNNSDEPQTVALKFGTTVVTPTIPARSFNTFTMTGAPVVVNAYDKIDARNAGVLLGSDGAIYKNLAFGTGAGRFAASSSVSKNGRIEIRLGSPTGKLVGSCRLSAGTGNCAITGCRDLQDVFIKAVDESGRPMEIDWFKFERYVPPAGKGDGLKGEYYENKDLSELKLTRVDRQISFTWGGGGPIDGMDGDDWSVRWTGKIEPLYNEDYTFYVTSDNGVRLWIDGKLLVDQWNDGYGVTHLGKVNLKTGRKYDIKIEYYEASGDASVKLEWESRSQIRQVVPGSQLYSEG